MEIRLKNQNPEIELLLKELEQEISYESLYEKNSKNQEDVMWLEITADQKDGYSLEIKEHETSIHYHKKYDLARAFLRLIDQSTTKSNEKDPKMEHMLDLSFFAETCAFEEFGVMFDCSRNAVLKVETVKKLIRLSALMGYHFIGLYLEDTLKVEKEPYLGYQRGAYTVEEIRAISRYAAIFDIKVRPYIQTLAHFNQIKQYEHYQDFMDYDDILLAKDERTYEFLEHLIETAASCFSDSIINIGMDEAHMVGLGKYLDVHGYEDRVLIMLSHLQRVHKICKKYGYKIQMWSDMFFKLIFQGDYYVEGNEKEIIEKIKSLDLPKEIQLIYWDYFSCDKSRYEDMLQKHLLLSPKAGFAGGAWKWTGFTPNNRFSIETSKAALLACKENKISSVVITLWGDNGAESSIFSVLPALFIDANIAYGGHMSQNAFHTMSHINFEDYLLLDEGNPFPEKVMQHNNASKFYLYNDPLLGTFDSVVIKHPKDYFKAIGKKLEPLCKDKSYGYLFSTQRALCLVLEDKADLGICIRSAYKQKRQCENIDETSADQTWRDLYQNVLPHLKEKIEQFYQIFKAQWERENKSYGFEIQTIRIGGLLKRIEDIIDMMEQFDTKKRSIIEPLEDETLPFAYFKNDTKEELSYNLWSDIVSPSVIG